jgi:GH15 family glucan-1,4-alpha-glucosidase
VPRLSIDFDPRPDYARAEVRLAATAAGIEVHGGPVPLFLSTNLPVPYVLNRQEFALTRPLFFLFGTERRPEVPALASVQHDLEETVATWRTWAKTCALSTFAAEKVLRSALCLSLHVYHDTGAIIAAATTSVPEAMGTQRTWDYRYCWLRDSAFVVEALRRLGHLEEGERFVAFLRDVAEAGPLQPLYGIGGERDLEEYFLPHLAGFGGNGHVRIGNAASLQQQNDLNGEIILCLETLLTDPRVVHSDRKAFFPLIQRLVEEAITLAPTPDMGLWEFRTMVRHYTFSRAMCWAAIDRGARLALLLDEPEHAARWARIAEAEREIVLRRGYSERLGFFTQSLDGEFPDASNLLLPTIGLLDGRDPRFLSTVAAYERLLVRDGLMLRYANEDDFGDTTSAFTICSFWWAEALALAGRLDEAVALFQRLTLFANPLGLFSEDVEPGTGRLLGNFPQAYTHVGLIHAAMTISELLEARDGRVRAWT